MYRRCVESIMSRVIYTQVCMYVRTYVCMYVWCKQGDYRSAPLRENKVYITKRNNKRYRTNINDNEKVDRSTPIYVCT